jgi:hypothetical protein
MRVSVFLVLHAQISSRGEVLSAPGEEIAAGRRPTVRHERSKLRPLRFDT